ncbi:MAG: hypothetical protein U1D30_00230 [Planctomycetota bacterium]
MSVLIHKIDFENRQQSNHWRGARPCSPSHFPEQIGELKEAFELHDTILVGDRARTN